MYKGRSPLQGKGQLIAQLIPSERQCCATTGRCFFGSLNKQMLSSKACAEAQGPVLADCTLSCRSRPATVSAVLKQCAMKASQSSGCGNDLQIPHGTVW
jgi:hypothetical protein